MTLGHRQQEGSDAKAAIPLLPAAQKAGGGRGNPANACIWEMEPAGLPAFPQGECPSLNSEKQDRKEHSLIRGAPTCEGGDRGT